MAKQRVVFSTISKDHDIAVGADRWEHWRPLIELMRMDGFFISKLFFFVVPSCQREAGVLLEDLRAVSPQSKIISVPAILSHDFTSSDVQEFYRFFDDYFRKVSFNTEEEEYFFHFGPGNLFSHSFMFTMLINMRKLPFRILHLRNPMGMNGHRYPHKLEIYNCDITSWVSEISNYERQRADGASLLKSFIKTNNPAFNTLINEMEVVAVRSSAPILFSGSTGSGKSQLARRIYELRKKLGRVSGDFVEINCSTIRGDSALSALFGHAKGAFTGAAAARRGCLLSAHNGILFLDEVGELDLNIQVLLLKAIEEKRFLPFGSDVEKSSNFQLICATNRNLFQDAAEGRFRPDLLSRINMWYFHLPSLNERREDIAPNIDYELRRISAEQGLFASFTQEARKKYLNFAVHSGFSWPGNFRTLSASVERMVTYSYGGVIDDRIVEREITVLSNMLTYPEKKDPAALPGVFTERNELVKAGGISDRDVYCGHGELSDCGGDVGDRGGIDKLSVSHSFPCIKSLRPELEAQLDFFDKTHLEAVIQVCRQAVSRTEAGRILFDVSRNSRKGHDDTSRLNKYLKSYGIDWQEIQNLRIR